ncbi:leucine-rich repeat domain-containing protein [Candidatus Saccharibacteria bacterium]|nr:leucine-rich repeat domain-containing protein [Candidatus Saccharibacteria bacterium]
MVVFATVVLEKIELGGATVAQGVILENEWLTREWLVEYAEVDDETLAIPEEAGFKGIADQAFVGFTGKRIVLPRGLIYIGKGAFKGLRQLETVFLPPELECIDESAFENCENLKEIVFPEGLKLIKRCAFCNCDSLEEVLIPSSVREIGRLAFYRCGSLWKLKIRNGVRYIGMRAFGDCDSLYWFHRWNLPRSMGIMRFVSLGSRTEDMWSSIFYGSPCEEGYWKRKKRERWQRKLKRMGNPFARPDS